MLGRLLDRRCTGERGYRIVQFGRRIDGAAILAVVAILAGGAAARALALDVAVGQEHALDRVKELFDRALLDQAGGAQPPVDVLREEGVFRRVGRVPVVEANVKAIQVARPIGGDAGHQLLRCDALGLGFEHDGCAVSVVGTDEMHGVAAHALEAYPDVGLRVLHDVADVKGRIGVGQGGGDEQGAAGHGGRRWCRTGNSSKRPYLGPSLVSSRLY